MTDNQCRSRQLLRYFGEEQPEDCGQCDVCLSRKSRKGTGINETKVLLLDLLKERKSLHLTELKKLNIPFELLEIALRELISEEFIINDDGILSLPD